MYNKKRTIKNITKKSRRTVGPKGGLDFDIAGMGFREQRYGFLLSLNLFGLQHKQRRSLGDRKKDFFCQLSASADLQPFKSDTAGSLFILWQEVSG